MKYKKNKAKTLKKHTRRRLAQRIKEFSDSEYKQIIESIQGVSKEIEVKHIYSQSRVKSVYRVNVEDKVFYVVYNKKFKELNTALSKEMFEERHPEYIKRR